MEKRFILIIFLISSHVFSQTLDWTRKANPLNQSINGVAFRQDGQKVLSGTNCHPASVRVFDVASGDLDWDYTVGSAYLCIMGVTFSSNNQYIAAIEEFGNIFIFDNTGTSPHIIDTINTGTSYGFSTAISPSNDRVAVGCSDGKMKVYALADGTLLNEINAHPNWITTVTYSPNGNYIVTGGDDNKVKIWSNSGTLLSTCNGHLGDITNVKVTPDNKYVVSSSKDKKINVWDIATGLLVRTIAGHTKAVNGIDISPNGSKIVSASADSTCKIWNLSNGDLLSTFSVLDSGAVNAVAWSPMGDKILTGNGKSDLSLWSVSPILGMDAVENPLNWNVYPNPAAEFVTIRVEELTTDLTIDLLDVTGKIVVSKQVTSYQDQLDLTSFNSGVYFLKLKNGITSGVRRIVKK